MEEANRVPVLGHTGWRKITAWSDCSRNVFVYGSYCAGGTGSEWHLKNYWYTQEQVYRPFYRNIMRQNSFFHIHIFLNFCDNKKDPSKTNDSYDQLCEMRSIYLTCAMIHMLHITAHMNIWQLMKLLCHSKIESCLTS